MSIDTPLGRVMLVDDEKFDQKMYRRIIDRSGLASEVISFTFAPDAVAYLQDPSTMPVDLILLDIRMPKMDGFEFIDAAQNYLGDIYETPVVMMLTTSLSPDDRARAEASEAIKGFLNKPLKVEHLESFIDLIDIAQTPKREKLAREAAAALKNAAPPASVSRL